MVEVAENRKIESPEMLKLLSMSIKSNIMDLNLSQKVEALDTIFRNLPENDPLRRQYESIRIKIEKNQGKGFNDGYNKHEGWLIQASTAVLSQMPEIHDKFFNKTMQMSGGINTGRVVEQKTLFRGLMDRIAEVTPKWVKDYVGKPMGKLMKTGGIMLIDNLFGDGRTTNMMVSSAIASQFLPGVSFDEVMKLKLGYAGKQNVLQGLGYEL